MEQEVVSSFEQLVALNNFCHELLYEEDLDPQELRLKKRYFYLLFILSLSLSDGITPLAAQGQTRALKLLSRSIYECYLNTQFIFSGRSSVWAYYLAYDGEKVRLSRAEALYADNRISKDVYKKRSKESRRFMRSVLKKYTQLPIIPGVIKENSTINSRSIKIRQRCQIIDHYNGLKKRSKPLTNRQLMATNYDTVYAYFSDTAHVSALELNSIFFRDGDKLFADVSGGKDRALLETMLRVSFLFQYYMMKTFINSVGRKKYHIPEQLVKYERKISPRKSVI